MNIIVLNESLYSNLSAEGPKYIQPDYTLGGLVFAIFGFLMLYLVLEMILDLLYGKQYIQDIRTNNIENIDVKREGKKK